MLYNVATFDRHHQFAHLNNNKKANALDATHTLKDNAQRERSCKCQNSLVIDALGPSNPAPGRHQLPRGHHPSPPPLAGTPPAATRPRAPRRGNWQRGEVMSLTGRRRRQETVGAVVVGLAAAAPTRISLCCAVDGWDSSFGDVVHSGGFRSDGVGWDGGWKSTTASPRGKRKGQQQGSKRRHLRTRFQSPPSRECCC